jgi:NADH:ubiquinone oxidoreductase subunit H
MYVCMCVCMCRMYVCMCVCMYVCSLLGSKPTLDHYVDVLCRLLAAGIATRLGEPRVLGDGGCLAKVADLMRWTAESRALNLAAPSKDARNASEKLREVEEAGSIAETICIKQM